LRGSQGVSMINHLPRRWLVFVAVIGSGKDWHFRYKYDAKN